MDVHNYPYTNTLSDDSKRAESHQSVVCGEAIANTSNADNNVMMGLSETVLQPFTRLFGEPLDENILKVKRASYPRPANAQMLTVPRLNGWLKENITTAQLEHDRSLQNVQSYMVATMSAVAAQAQALEKLKRWAENSSHPEISEKTSRFVNSYDALMDANHLMTRAMFETNQVRREIVKHGMSNSLLELLVDEHKPTAEWLAGQNAWEGNLSMLIPTSDVSESTRVAKIKVEEDATTELRPTTTDDLSDAATLSAMEDSDDTEEWSDDPSSSVIQETPTASKKPDSCTDNTPAKSGLPSQAGKKTNISSSHVKVDMPSVCFDCGKRFRNMRTLNEHMKTHAGSNPIARSDGGEKVKPSSFITIQLRRATANDLPKLQTKSKVSSNAAKESGKPSDEAFQKPNKTRENSELSADDTAVKKSSLPSNSTKKNNTTCPICGREFTRSHGLKRHMTTHTRETRHICPECGKELPFLSSLKRHMIGHTGERPYTCSECGKRFSAECDLKRHMQYHTRERKYHVCSYCDKEFTAMSYLRVHLVTHTGEKQHLCELCGQAFGTAAAQRVHVRRKHSADKPHACNICDKRFLLNWDLKQHMRIHTGEKPLLCTECGAAYSHKASLRIHMRTHTGEKNHKCSECGRAFAEPITLKVHMRTHTGEKPYPCSYCAKSFISYTMLKVHKRIHTGEKPYGCPDCGKCFSQSWSLKTHQRIHTGEKPYVCSECGKAFIEAVGLRSHMRTHTEEQPYTCQLCGEGFPRKRILTSHMKTHTVLLESPRTFSM